MNSGSVDIKTTDFAEEYSGAGFTITVFNKDLAEPWVNPNFEVCKPSALGQRFPRPNKEEAVAKYREWIRGRGRNNIAIQKELLVLFQAMKRHRRIGLVCVCHPAPCHAGEIAMLLLEYAFYERPG